MNLKLSLAYDGEAYVGWQRQTNGISVQEKLEEALQQICGKPIVVHGASRTDQGVHALGMATHFEWPKEQIKPLVLQRALNALLPNDIRVLRIVRAPKDFHARFSASSKLYRYRILNKAIADLFQRKVTWFIHQSLDIEAMNKAASTFIGKHDFSSVAVNPGYKRTSMVRNIYRCAVLKRKDEIHIEIEADGFLYKMVRTIVGTLVEVGLGKRSANSIGVLLKARSRSLAGKVAPAHGLFLVRVNYRH